MFDVLDEKARQLSESFSNLTGGLQSAIHAVMFMIYLFDYLIQIRQARLRYNIFLFINKALQKCVPP